MTTIERLLRKNCIEGKEAALINDVIEFKKHLGVRELNTLKNKEFKEIQTT